MTQRKTPGFSTHPELGTQRSTHQHSKKAASLLRVLSIRSDTAKHLILVELGGGGWGYCWGVSESLSYKPYSQKGKWSTVLAFLFLDNYISNFK